MTTLTIKNLPDELYSLLKLRAGAHRRSINSEAIVCLEAILFRRDEGEASLLAELRELREEAGPYLTDDDLRAAKDEGRA